MNNKPVYFITAFVSALLSCVLHYAGHEIFAGHAGAVSITLCVVLFLEVAGDWD